MTAPAEEPAIQVEGLAKRFAGAAEPVFDVATMTSSYVRVALELSRSADR